MNTSEADFGDIPSTSSGITHDGAPSMNISEVDCDDIPSTSSGITHDGAPSTSGRKSIVPNVEEIARMWNLVAIYEKCKTREGCIQFAEELGLIAKSRLCRFHRSPMQVTLAYNNTVGSFRCRKGKCYSKTPISRATGTFFENAKIYLSQIFYLIYAYANHWQQLQVRKEYFFRDTVFSSATICDWYNYCREAVVLYQIEQHEEQGKIGGPGKIVQIEESKFGKQKYHKGRPVKGHWVLGMIEDGTDNIRMEVCPDNIRSAAVLIPIIKKHIIDGTTIHTDYWKAYDCLPLHGYVHRKVNHSDPDNPFVAKDGTHTQRIESQWNAFKRYLKKDSINNPQDFTDLIFEYIWRKKIARNHEDPFVKLIEAIKYTYES